MIFDRLADGIQNHAKAVVVLWAIILCFAGYFAIQAGDVMSYDLNDMAPTDSESIKGIEVIATYFPSSDVSETKTPIIVIYFENAEECEASLQFLDELNAASSEIEGVLGVSHMDPIVTSTGDGIVMGYMIMDSSKDINVISMTPELRDFIAEVKEANNFTGDVYLTGTPAISYDMEHNALEDVSKIDPFTVLMILILVGLFFRSFVTSAVPPMTIGVAFVVTMAGIFFLGHVMNVFFITNMMILVSMMGAGCDYCIFIIARYREELRKGKDHHDALHEAIVWAGESITISGASVIIGFGALAVCKYSMISTLGVCLALGILIALLAALTLIPAILQLVGDRIFWPTKMDAFKEGGKATRGWFAWCGNLGNKYFHMSAEFSIKHAKAIAIVAILVSVPAAYVTVESEDSYDMITAMLSGDSGKGMEYIGKYADQGMVSPNYTVIEYKESLADVIQGSGLSMNLLYWTDFWKEEVFPTLTGDKGLYSKILTDENIAYIDGPFMWDDMLDQIEKAGITDINEKLDFVKKNISAKSGLIFNQVVQTLADRGLPPEALFNGPGYIISGSLYQAGYLYDWDAAVAQAEGTGLTDPKEIIAYVENDFNQMYPDNPQVLETIVNAMLMYGLNEDILVNGFAPVIDYIMNVYPSVVGGDYVDSETGKAKSGTVTYISLLSATEQAAMSPRSMESIEHIGDCVKAYVDDNKAIVVEKWDTGTAVVMYEVSEQVKEQFTNIEILVVVLIIILLFVVMRSYLIPIRSVLTILMSISWTLAMTHLIFVDLLGGEILWMIPIILLVICLGLGMDYDILLTTRIKENVMARGMSNDDAIRHAVTHTGSVITICGLIMGGAFGTLMISGMTLLQQFGFALCFAILADALIVRTYIVPAVMHLLGDWNWKGPGAKKIEKNE